MIPNKFHFIYLTHTKKFKQFSLIHYLCIKSALMVNNPDIINIYINVEPVSEYWEKTKKLEKINIVFIEPPTEIFGIPISEPAHQSDVIRLQALIETGGIYIDTDSICVKPYTPLLNNEFVLGQQGIDGIEGLCPAAILSEKNSRFAKEWLSGFSKSFRGGKPGSPDWCTHSVMYPSMLSKSMPNEITILPYDSFFYPLYHQNGLKMLFEQDLEFPNAYSHHLWETVSGKDYLGKITEEYIKNVDTTYNKIARKIL